MLGPRVGVLVRLPRPMSLRLFTKEAQKSNPVRSRRKPGELM